MNNTRIKVLYIAGCGRTGSTILGNILGQVEGFTHVGELQEIWRNLPVGQPPCGCGTPVAACKMWQEVMKKAYGGVSESFVTRMMKFRNLDARDRECLRALVSNPKHTREKLTKQLAEVESLYRAIQNVFGCKVIVDSSKHPMYAHILKLIEGIDLHVLHLVRDPRAWADAFLYKKVREGYVLYMRPFQSCIHWNLRNWAAELMSARFKYHPMSLRYEDFVADPQGSLTRILQFVGHPSLQLPLEGEHNVNLRVQHTVSGNPNRFATGRIEIKDNQEWRVRMSRRHRVFVTLATWPLLAKYGYHLRNANFSSEEIPREGTKLPNTVSAGYIKSDAEAEFANAK
jgi:hypothetical protein